MHPDSMHYIFLYGVYCASHGSSMGLLWATHGFLLLEHGSPVGLIWVAHGFGVLTHGSLSTGP